MKSDEASQLRRWLQATGFSEDLTVDGDRLKVPESDDPLDPADFEVPAAYRCHSGTGPETTVFAIASANGEPIGTFVADHSTSASPEMQSITDVLQARTKIPTAVCDQDGHQHIAAVFPDREAAGVAVAELQEHGLGSDHLGIAVHGTDRVTFERAEENVVGTHAAAGTAAGASVGAFAGMALTALVIPGLAPLGVAGLFAIGAATGFSGAMLGGYLGVAAAGDKMTTHDEIKDTPLEPGEVLVAVLAHGESKTVESVMKRNSGKLLGIKPTFS